MSNSPTPHESSSPTPEDQHQEEETSRAESPPPSANKTPFTNKAGRNPYKQTPLQLLIPKPHPVSSPRINDKYLNVVKRPEEDDAEPIPIQRTQVTNKKRKPSRFSQQRKALPLNFEASMSGNATLGATINTTTLINQSIPIGQQQQQQAPMDYSFFITKGPQIQFPAIKPSMSSVNNVDAALEGKKAELQRIQNLLEEKRKEYEKNSVLWKEKETELTRKRNEFDSSQKEMKQFNQINESKIDKYYRKAIEEQKQNDAKRDAIADLQATIINLNKQKKKKEMELTKIHLYQNYLNMVARFDNNTFEDDMDKILKRYETLFSSVSYLKNLIENRKDQIKQTTADMKNFQKQATNKLYELNVDLQHKRSILDKLKNKTYNLESAYTQQDQVNRKQSQLLSQITMSINNLNQRCQETKVFKPQKQPKFITDRLEQNMSEELKTLTAVHHRIEDVEAIVNSIKQE